MGLSLYERAYRRYAFDKERGNSWGKDLYQEGVKRSLGEMATGISVGLIAVVLMRPLVSDDVGWIKGTLIFILAYLVLNSLVFTFVAVIGLIEDWWLLRLYRQCEEGSKEVEE